MQFRINKKFTPEKHCHIEKVVNYDTNSGTEIKKFKYGENNSNIFDNDFSSVKSTELKFMYKEIAKNFTLEQVNNEFSTFDTVNVLGLIYNL